MVFREEGGVRFRGEGDLTGDATALVPHRIGLQVPAGRYRLELKAVDAWQKRVAHYRQQVVVENYAADSLRLSRIHMAWRITEADAETAFMKDGLEVVPLPTRTYDRGSGVFAYYEIYNMSKDEFGRTHYQVTYDVRPVQGDHGTGVISMLTRLGRDHREAVAVSYDRSGESETEVEFVELRLSDQPEGQQILTIRVEDLILGRATEREVRFSIGE